MLGSDALNRRKQTEKEGEGREKKRWGEERVEERDFALPFFRFSFPVRQKGILGCTHSGKAISPVVGLHPCQHKPIIK